jgi:hypothetical protein
MYFWHSSRFKGRVFSIVMFGLYLAILLYMGNIGNSIIGWDMSIIAPVNPVPDDVPNMLKIMRSIYSLWRER